MIESDDVVGMVTHWLSTPVNGYFGSGYGADRASLLLAPLSSNRADAFLAKMRRDIPLLGMLSDDMLSIEAERQGFEVIMLHIRIGAVLIPVGTPVAGTSGETTRANSF